MIIIIIHIIVFDFLLLLLKFSFFSLPKIFAPDGL